MMPAKIMHQHANCCRPCGLSLLVCRGCMCSGSTSLAWPHPTELCRASYHFLEKRIHYHSRRGTCTCKETLLWLGRPGFSASRAWTSPSIESHRFQSRSTAAMNICDRVGRSQPREYRLVFMITSLDRHDRTQIYSWGRAVSILTGTLCASWSAGCGAHRLQLERGKLH